MIIQNIKKTIELSKNNKPYTRVLLQFDEYKDGKGNLRWISGFGNKFTWEWEVGDDVNPEIVEKDGKYLNFSFNDTDQNRLDVFNLNATVGFVMELLKPKQTPPQTTKQEIEPQNDNIPF